MSFSKKLFKTACLNNDFHKISPSALPKPGRIRELLALVSRLHAQRMDHHRPMWECYLIEGIEGNRFAIYTKIHHSLVDGVAATRLMQSRMARSPEEDLPPIWSAHNSMLMTPSA